MPGCIWIASSRPPDVATGAAAIIVEEASSENAIVVLISIRPGRPSVIEHVLPHRR